VLLDTILYVSVFYIYAMNLGTEAHQMPNKIAAVKMTSITSKLAAMFRGYQSNFATGLGMPKSGMSS